MDGALWAFILTALAVAFGVIAAGFIGGFLSGPAASSG